MHKSGDTCTFQVDITVDFEGIKATHTLEVSAEWSAGFPGNREEPAEARGWILDRDDRLRSILNDEQLDAIERSINGEG